VTLRDAAPTSRAMVVAVMVSLVAFLDATVINLALPAIEHDLGGGLVLQQWIIDGYLLAMAATILPAEAAWKSRASAGPSRICSDPFR
jgi:MFS family permease